MNSPIRTCVGCRTPDERANLVRHVLVGGRLVRDEAARLPGRGAWLHDDPACAALALKRGGFARSFRTKVDAAELLGGQPERQQRRPGPPNR